MNTRRAQTLVLFVCLLVCLIPNSEARAAYISLRSTEGTAVDSINSLSLKESFVTEPIEVGNLRASVIGITFSIHAYKDAIRIPLAAAWNTSAPTNPSTLVALSSKYESAQNTPLVAGTIVPHTTSQDGFLTIAPGTTGEATLLLAYAGTPDGDRVDKLTAVSMPLYFGTSTVPLWLNRSEVADLYSPAIELGL